MIDSALGIQLRGDVGAADQIDRNPRLSQGGLQRTLRFLAGADDDVVHRQHAGLVTDDQVQAGVVDATVLSLADNLHALQSQRPAMRPSGGLAKVSSDFFVGPLAKEQGSGRRRRARAHIGNAATAIGIFADAPFLVEGMSMQSRRRCRRIVGEKLRGIDAYPAGANQRRPPPHFLAPEQHVGIAHHFRMIDAGDIGPARRHAGGQHHPVEGAADKLLCLHSPPDPHGDLIALELCREVTHGLCILFLAGHVLGHVELPAELFLGLE